jgi:hypothetical protein
MSFQAVAAVTSQACSAFFNASTFPERIVSANEAMLLRGARVNWMPKGMTDLVEIHMFNCIVPFIGRGPYAASNDGKFEPGDQPGKA